MEALIPVLADLTATPMRTLPELMPAGTHVVAVHPEKIRTRIADLQATDAEFQSKQKQNCKPRIKSLLVGRPAQAPQYKPRLPREIPTTVRYLA